MVGNVLNNTVKVFGLALAILIYFAFRIAPSTPTAPVSTASPTAQGGLTISEEADRISYRWVGKVDTAMVKTLETSLARHRYDERPIMLSLNSSGGQVAAGRDILDLIDWMKRVRRLETHVERGAICASMCVPVYLAGSRRTADPKARFMFHEARIAKESTEYVEIRKKMQSVMSSRDIDQAERMALKRTNDTLFGSDLNYWDINETWLRKLREAVRGGKDVWLTAEQLVDQGSGVVHALE